ncbi:serine/threonine protein kinase [Caldimonas brevitalea]|uniref:Serine/threonine protein kinase n=1 Tax=Caldimonas brevitalea TaxID=413882 RepID=A0A0G3BTM6_9BURK|nr:serine/threonine protein kinase [Caldimonas brevitalea]
MFAEALTLPPSQRLVFVARLAADDAALAEELGALFDAAASSSTLLDRPLVAMLSVVDVSRIGHQLGPYRIVALIGRGGMGEVYRAERADGQFEQQVAIKLMTAALDREHAISRFQAERQILANLDHPNLAKVFDGGVTEDGQPYFVMELVDGEPIDLYAERRQLPVAPRLELFRTVCQVVHYAHGKCVVHRDLKPSNILVTGSGLVKLLDFGIAKRLALADSNDQTSTWTAQRILTLAYSSPEQVQGDEITPASDIYSLGVVLHRLLTGRSPYLEGPTNSDYELAKAICDGEATPPSKAAADRRLRAQLRGDLDAVVLKALRKDPGARYASAEHLADDVFRHLERLPVHARRGAWSYRAGRFVLRHRIAVAVALMANLAMVVGLAVAAHQAYEATRERERAERHFADVRQLANVFIFDIHDAIRDLPGSTPVRRLVVEKALAYLQKLSSEAGSDASLLVEIAAGYRKAADVQGAGVGSNLGDPKGAMSSYEKARALLEPLVASRNDRNADLAAAQRELAVVCVLQAQLLSGLGKFNEADAVFRRGLSVAGDLATADPSFENQLRLARLYMRQSIAQLDAGQMAAYVKTSETSIRLLEALVARQPEELDAEAYLVSAYSKRGQYFVHIGQFHKAMVASRKALSISERQHAKYPNNTRFASNVAGGHNNLGATLQQAGESKQAAQEFRRAIELISSLMAKDPGNVNFGINLATANANISESLFTLGDVAGSIDAAQTALTLFDDFRKDVHMRVNVRSVQGEAHYHLAKALEARASGQNRDAAAFKKDRQEACQNYRRAFDILEDLKDRASLPPDNVRPEMARKAMQDCPLQRQASR